MAHTTNHISLVETDDHSVRVDHKILSAHNFKDGYSNVPLDSQIIITLGLGLHSSIFNISRLN